MVGYSHGVVVLKLPNAAVLGNLWIMADSHLAPVNVTLWPMQGIKFPVSAVFGTCGLHIANCYLGRRRLHFLSLSAGAATFKLSHLRTYTVRSSYLPNRAASIT
jgi:hypothetical protein